ncbi:MAG: oligosaccharide flippase family protein [Flavobacteriales bacterium]|nr:oligosaccharide flippase family protein [Flavobacteriales bacterium]
MSLRASISKSIKWTGFASVFMAASQFLLYAILIRLMPPTEIALVALVFFVVQSGNILMEAAFGYNLLIDKYISPFFFQSLWSTNVVISICLAFICWLFGLLLSHFYENPELNALIQFGSLLIPISAIGMPSRVLLKRVLEFSLIAKIQLFGVILGFIITILLATYSWGAWAILFGYLIRTLAEHLAYLKYSPEGYLIRWQRPQISIFGNIRKGVYYATERGIDVFASQLDILVIGKVLGLEALGLYELAKRFLFRPANMMSDAIESVLLPVIAQRKDQQVLIFEKLSNIITSIISLPIFLVLLLNDEISVLLFGSTGQRVSPLFFLLAVALLVRIPRLPVDTLVLGAGKSKLWLHWKLISLPIIVLFILLGIRKDIEVFCYYFIALQLVLSLAAFFILIRPITSIHFLHYLLLFLQAIAPGAISFFLVLALEASYSHPLLSLGTFTILSIILSRMINPDFVKTLWMFFKTSSKMKLP